MDRSAVAASLALVFLSVCWATASGPKEQSATSTVASHGLSIELPVGWDGRAYESAAGLLVAQAANFPLLDARNDDLATTSQRHIARDGILIVVLNSREPPPAGQSNERVAATLPLRIRPQDFRSFGCGISAPASAMRSALVGGRVLQVFVFLGATTAGDEGVDVANAVLAGLAAL